MQGCCGASPGCDQRAFSCHQPGRCRQREARGGVGGRGGALSFLLQAPSSPEPHWPPRARSESPGGPPGGLEPSLQAFQGTCVLFVSFHYHSHSGESKHKQTNLTTRRCRWGGKGDIYVYVQLLQRDRQRCFELSRGRTISEWAWPPLGVWRADYKHLGLSSEGAL